PDVSGRTRSRIADRRRRSTGKKAASGGWSTPITLPCRRRWPARKSPRPAPAARPPARKQRRRRRRPRRAGRRRPRVRRRRPPDPVDVHLRGLERILLKGVTRERRWLGAASRRPRGDRVTPRIQTLKDVLPNGV